MAAAGANATAAVGIDEATLTRDRRAAERPMGIWQIAEDLWGVGTGSDDYSEHVVDLEEGRCTCKDWRFRGRPGRGEIARCYHASRVLQALGRIEPPADADVDPALEAQRSRWSA